MPVGSVDYLSPAEQVKKTAVGMSTNVFVPILPISICRKPDLVCSQCSLPKVAASLT